MGSAILYRRCWVGLRYDGSTQTLLKEQLARVGFLRHIMGDGLQHRPQGLFLLGRSLQIAVNHRETLGSFV